MIIFSTSIFEMMFFMHELKKIDTTCCFVMKHKVNVLFQNVDNF